MHRECDFCGNVFEATRDSIRFCSRRCRDAQSRQDRDERERTIYFDDEAYIVPKLRRISSINGKPKPESTREWNRLAKETAQIISNRPDAIKVIRSQYAI